MSPNSRFASSRFGSALAWTLATVDLVLIAGILALKAWTPHWPAPMVLLRLQSWLIEDVLRRGPTGPAIVLFLLAVVVLWLARSICKRQKKAGGKVGWSGRLLLGLGGLDLVGAVALMALALLWMGAGGSRLKRSMSDLRSIGTAIECYLVDYSSLPQVGEGLVMDLLPEHLEPTYIRKLPQLDGWNYPYQVRVKGGTYLIWSLGNDYRSDGCPGGATTSYEADICFSDGDFVQYPEGSR